MTIKVTLQEGAFSSVSGYLLHMLHDLKPTVVPSSSGMQPIALVILCHFRGLWVFLINNPQGMMPSLALEFSFDTLLDWGFNPLFMQAGYHLKILIFFPTVSPIL